MKVLQGFSEPGAYRGGCISIGNFDGVHLGHRRMIEALRRQADLHSVNAVVFTFAPHPIQILRPDRAPPALTTTAHKLELLAECGIDTVIVYPTDRALLDLTAETFFRDVVQTELQASGLVEGPNFNFGRGREGSVETLRGFCTAAGLPLEVVAPVEVDGKMVSSSVIRDLIDTGHVAEAARLLGQPYRLTGRVVTGAKRGRTIGFPTANLAEVTTVIPAEGVYAARVAIDGRNHAAGVNIGPNPTFGESVRKLEAHILDYAGDLYGRTLDVEFVDRLRGTQPFNGVDALIAQLKSDMQAVRGLVKLD